MIRPSPNKVDWTPALAASIADWSSSSLRRRRQLWANRRQTPTSLPWVHVAPWQIEVYAFFGFLVIPLWVTAGSLIGATEWAWIPFIASCFFSSLGLVGLCLAGSIFNIVVDDRGLWLLHRGVRLWPTNHVLRIPRHRFLPAEEIGAIWAIDTTKFTGIPSVYNYNGLPVGGGQLTTSRYCQHAVLVHQNRVGLERQYWMFEHPHPHVLAAALQLCREQAWGGASTSGRLKALFAPTTDDSPTIKEALTVATELCEPINSSDIDPSSQPGLTRQFEITGIVNVAPRTVAPDGSTTLDYGDHTEPGHPAEQLALIAELRGNGDSFEVDFVVADEQQQTFAGGRRALANWITDAACHPGHDSDEQLYTFPDEKSILAAHQMLHNEALLRTEVVLNVVSAATDATTEERRVTVYVMADSTWLLEHIEPTDAGRYLRLRSTGRRYLCAYFEQLLAQSVDPTTS